MDRHSRIEEREAYFEHLEKEQRIVITSRQKELIFRSFALGLTEEQIESFLFLNDLKKQEYLIGCFLDDIPKQLIDEQMAVSASLMEMKQHKKEYFSQDQLREMQMTELLHTIERQKEEIRLLKEEKEGEAKAVQRQSKSGILVTRCFYWIRKFKRKKTCLEEKGKTVSIDTEACELLTDPTFNLSQIKELQQGLLDGIAVSDIKRIAKPELTPEAMESLRGFLSQVSGCDFTKVRKKEEAASYEGENKIKLQEAQIEPTEIEITIGR